MSSNPEEFELKTRKGANGTTKIDAIDLNEAIDRTRIEEENSETLIPEIETRDARVLFKNAVKKVISLQKVAKAFEPTAFMDNATQCVDALYDTRALIDQLVIAYQRNTLSNEAVTNALVIAKQVNADLENYVETKQSRIGKASGYISSSFSSVLSNVSKTANILNPLAYLPELPNISEKFDYLTEDELKDTLLEVIEVATKAQKTFEENIGKGYCFDIDKIDKNSKTNHANLLKTTKSEVEGSVNPLDINSQAVEAAYSKRYGSAYTQLIKRAMFIKDSTDASIEAKASTTNNVEEIQTVLQDSELKSAEKATRLSSITNAMTSALKNIKEPKTKLQADIYQTLSNISDVSFELADNYVISPAYAQCTWKNLALTSCAAHVVGAGNLAKAAGYSAYVGAQVATPVLSQLLWTPVYAGKAGAYVAKNAGKYVLPTVVSVGGHTLKAAGAFAAEHPYAAAGVAAAAYLSLTDNPVKRVAMKTPEAISDSVTGLCDTASSVKSTAVNVCSGIQSTATSISSGISSAKSGLYSIGSSVCGFFSAPEENTSVSDDDNNLGLDTPTPDSM